LAFLNGTKLNNDPKIKPNNGIMINRVFKVEILISSMLAAVPSRFTTSLFPKKRERINAKRAWIKM
jgi:hypothetical protein